MPFCLIISYLVRRWSYCIENNGGNEFCIQWRARRALSWRGCGNRIYRQTTRCPELPTNNDRLLTSDDRNAGIHRQTVELPTVSAKWGV